MQSSTIDYAVAGVLLLFTALGLHAGLARSVFRLLGWAGGALGAYIGPEWLIPALNANLASSPPYVSRFAALLLGFLLPFVLCSLLGYLLHRLVSWGPLGSLNRLGGAALGFLKGLILCTLLMALLGLLPAKGSLALSRDGSIAYDVYVWAHLTWTEGHFPTP